MKPADLTAVQLTNGKILNVDTFNKATPQEIEEYIDLVPKRIQGIYFNMTQGQTNQSIKIPDTARYLLGIATMHNTLFSSFNVNLQAQFTDYDNTGEIYNVEKVSLYVDQNFYETLPFTSFGKYYTTLIRPVNSRTVLSMSFNNLGNVQFSPYHLILLYI